MNFGTPPALNGNTSQDPRRQINFGEPVTREQAALPGSAALRERVGLGSAPNDGSRSRGASAGVGAADIAAPFMDGLGCDISKIPVIHSTRGGFGPLPDATVGTFFGANCNVLALNPAAAPSGFTGVQTTFPTNGELQTYVMICGVFQHLEPESWMFTLPGNAWSGANAGTAQTPLSPDVFSSSGIGVAQSAGVCNDLTSTNSALGPVFASTDVYDPAVLDWGRWLDYAFWHLALAYNWFWSYGQHTTLMNVPLRYIAYMPQIGDGAGTMPVEVQQYVRRVNAYYRSASQATTSQFLPQNARRTGSITSTTGTISKFSPDRSFDRVNAIFGGTMLRGLVCGNEKVYRLPAPYIMRPGVSLGMQLNISDSSEQQLMQQELSISQGLGLNGVGGNVPPSILPDVNILSGASQAGSATITAQEQTTDNPPVATQIRVFPQRRVYKGGLGFITTGLTGYEITEGQAQQLRDNPDAASILYMAAGCRLLG